jgi:AcrR family transcriptional regulator
MYSTFTTLRIFLVSTRPVPPATRRDHLLDAALGVFVRLGYRKASMDDIAQAASMSRPGLYFHFATKEQLFQATVEHELSTSLDAVQTLLAREDVSLSERIIDAFDQWLGRYTDPAAADVGVLAEANRDTLAQVFDDYRDRFDRAVAAEIDAAPGAVRAGAVPGIDVARTLHATATGWKHDVAGRNAFRQAMTTAVYLVISDD